MFANRTVAQVKRLLGWTGKSSTSQEIISHRNVKIPNSFDARTAWPNCPSIAQINDQARCGSCWAFGAVESVTDRFCVASKGSFTTQLSFQDLVSCDDSDDGCEGGSAEGAHNYIERDGLVPAACSPYTVPTCAPAQEPCLNFVDTPSCKKSCSDNEIWTKSKHFISKWNSIDSDVNSIGTELMTNGPVEACFSVYEDFLSYKSGVYRHTSGDYLGGHCLKITGWGVDSTSNEPYWILSNSWTTYWGNQGTVNILRGKDECGIEDDVVAGVPDL